MTSQLELEFSDKIEIVYSIINECRIYQYEEIRCFKSVRYSSETNILVNHRILVAIICAMECSIPHPYHRTFVRIRFNLIKFVNERHKVNYDNRAINYIHHRQLIIPINQLYGD